MPQWMTLPMTLSGAHKLPWGCLAAFYLSLGRALFPLRRIVSSNKYIPEQLCCPPFPKPQGRLDSSVLTWSRNMSVQQKNPGRWTRIKFESSRPHLGWDANQRVDQSGQTEAAIGGKTDMLNNTQMKSQIYVISTPFIRKCLGRDKLFLEREIVLNDQTFLLRFLTT